MNPQAQGESASNKEENESRQTRLTPTRAVTYWLFAIVLLYTLYFAKTLFLPIVVAALFALLLSPVVSFLQRFYVPRTLSALILITMIGVPFTLLGMQLAEPAQKWGKRIPELSSQLTTELNEISQTLSTVEMQAEQNTAQQVGKEQSFRWFGWFRSDEAKEEPTEAVSITNPVSDRFKQGGMELVVEVLGATPVVLAQFFTFLILVIFMLVFSPLLYANFISGFSHERDREAANSLLNEVQRELSRYILTVSVINTGLGVITGLALWSAGVDDALLWGVMVALLNFAPYVGPIIALLVLYLAGVIQYGAEWIAFMPVLIFFSINIIEAQYITPTVLGRNMRLNPLILILWVVLWGWLWGAVGVLIAVPLLVCLKLAAARLNVLTQWVRLIETPG
ncbi:AI-2E family transporter [Thalassolituus sp.]|uniref:AI-2E family transporter n=1 Tax=Thalassolituus sp. TaxID=2030822 RepID=UPI002A84062E|nr:AI-2E family transporter [Thalassolituus sp.]